MNLAARPISRRALLGGAGALALSGSLTAVLSACGSQAETVTSTGPTIELVTPNYAPYLQTFAAAVGDAYTQRTGTKVKLINTGNSSFVSVNQRIQSDLAAGHTAALALIGVNDVARYATAQRSIALDGLANADHFDTSQLYPGMISLGTRNGQLYAMPFAISTLILYYNADAFTKAGLDPDHPPTSFSDLRTCAKALVESRTCRYGVTFANDSDNWIFQNFLFSNGGSMLAADNKTPVFNQTPGVEVVKFWADLFTSGFGHTMSQTEEIAAFARGDLAMMLDSSSHVSKLSAGNKFELRTAEVPIPDGGTRRCPAGGAYLIMLTKDNAQQQRAFGVLTELAEPASVTTLVKESGYSPVNKIAATGSQYLGEFLAKNPLYGPGTKQLDNIVSWFQWPGNNTVEIDDKLSQQISLALRGAKSPADALNAAADQAKALL
ncbi:ABC transporter substrate-binding protein [Nocardia africana]|uniref:ABC transporter substrate-binding protein n=1 Tax=Nocardia africana TaxID=134964 RepID=A0ABW6NTQ9_9NOCA